MSSAGSEADPKLPHDLFEEILKPFAEGILTQRLTGRELPQDLVEDIRKRVIEDIQKRIVEDIRKRLPLLPDLPDVPDLSDLPDVIIVEEFLKRLDVKPLPPYKCVCKLWQKEDIRKEIRKRKRVVEDIPKRLPLLSDLSDDIILQEILKRLAVKSLLPDDIILEEILKHLAVKSLLRYKCVCKLWKENIENSRFVDLHLKQSALLASNWHLASVEWCCDSQQSLCCLFSERSSPERRTRLGRSVDGYGRVYLWNLFTKQRKDVPAYRSEDESFSIRTSLGFGFHRGDYKIVMILCHPLNGKKNGKKKGSVGIFSLKTGSWRSPECVPAFCCSNLPVVCLNGKMHWFVSKPGPKSIFSFDLSNEKFEEMALPEKIVRGSKVKGLLVLNDSLAVCTVRKEGSACSVWVVEEYRGGRPEWTESDSFSVNGQVIDGQVIDGQVTGFDGFMRNGELLMVIDDDERVSYHLENKVFKRRNTLKGQSNLVTVIESLVSP